MDNLEHTAERARNVSQPLRWFETLAITAICFALGAWNRPDDPFYLSGSFPWPVLGPLLVGLRYGFFMALVASILIVAGLDLYQRYLGVLDEPYPYIWAVGILGVSLVAGEFRDYWERRRAKLEASNDYREARLEEFTRNYYLLKVSHDRLEQQLAGSSRSLREALRRLYDELGQDSAAGLTRSRANAMLQLLVRYGQLQIAGIFPVQDGQALTEPLATVGNAKILPATDPLVQHALAEAKLISIQTEYRQRQPDMDTRFLAVIPFIDANGHINALCAIEAMPFFSFEPQALRFLAILAGHMADIIVEQDHTTPTDPPALRTLRHQLARVGRDAEDFDLPGALLALHMPAGLRAQQVAEHIKRVRRGLDLVYEKHSDRRLSVLVLMPLTDELGQAGYIQRLEDGIREQLGVTLIDVEGELQVLQIADQKSAETWLQEALDHGE
ncbi:PelD GGDEF domain-containing protein [Marinobacter fonticola]|uniref:PelD GGDEF domain-containing protein n=1 Tax=Marinobacter fonticola TaxID=2603215 RepID=UPI0011E82E6A|nr:PelD GGDEF domain-containing protein [Marinobacter fonticola]